MLNANCHQFHQPRRQSCARKMKENIHMNIGNDNQTQIKTSKTNQKGIQAFGWLYIYMLFHIGSQTVVCVSSVVLVPPTGDTSDDWTFLQYIKATVIDGNGFH